MMYTGIISENINMIGYDILQVYHNYDYCSLLYTYIYIHIYMYLYICSLLVHLEYINLLNITEFKPFVPCMLLCCPN